MNDTAGSMLFFPISTVPVSTGMWSHTAVLGRYGDAAAYYSSLGGAWDTLWLVLVVVLARFARRHDLVAHRLDDAAAVLLGGGPHDVDADPDHGAGLGVAQRLVKLGRADDVSKEDGELGVLAHGLIIYDLS